MDTGYVFKVLRDIDVELLSRAFKHLSWNGLSENSLKNLQPNEKLELLKFITLPPKKGKSK